MAAPEGNQFWRMRSKHGRERIFATPDALWQAAEEYFAYSDSTPWQKIDFKGKDLSEVKIPTSRPYTIRAFCLFCDVNENYWNQFKKKADDGFSWVITRIEDIIYVHKFEGAVVGAFNPNIIARELGLVDKKQVSIEPPVTSDDLDKLTTEEIEALLSAKKKLTQHDEHPAAD